MARIRIAHRVDSLEKIIEARIRRGIYLRGERLPAERELAEELNFSRGTIRKAYRSLHHRGLIEYTARRYRVTENPGELEISLNETNPDYYAVFYSPQKSSGELMTAIEKELRKEGCVPLMLNLEALECEGSQLNFLSTFHVVPRAALFLASSFGIHNTPLTQSYLDSLPIPYLFVGAPPLEITSAYFAPTPNYYIQQIQKYLDSALPRSLILAWPWPMSEYEALLLQKISILLSGEKYREYLPNGEIHWHIQGKAPNSLAPRNKKIIYSPSLRPPLSQKNAALILGHCEGEHHDSISLSIPEIASGCIRELRLLHRKVSEGTPLNTIATFEPNIIPGKKNRKN